MAVQIDSGLDMQLEQMQKHLYPKYWVSFLMNISCIDNRSTAA